MNQRRHDVAIVGGGPTGLALGALLAGIGIDVVVLERRPTASNRNRAIGIHAAAMRVLDEVGVADAVQAEAVVIERGVADCQRRRLAELDLGDAPVRTLPQPRTEALLTARLEQLAPGALRRGEAVICVEPRDDEVQLQVDVGGGETRRYDARYVVGADGARSAVRAAIGSVWRRHGQPAHYAMADESRVVSGLAAAELHLEPGGVVERFPLPSAHRWVVRLPQRVTTLGRTEFAAVVFRRLGAGPATTALGQVSPFTARQHLATPFARGRIALLGDAAHELSPIGGQGMNLGWLDAAVLARLLERALEEGAPGEPFAAYERRRRAARQAMRRAAWNTALGAPIDGLGLGMRNAAVRLLGTRPWRSVARAIVTVRD